MFYSITIGRGEAEREHSEGQADREEHADRKGKADREGQAASESTGQSVDHAAWAAPETGADAEHSKQKKDSGVLTPQHA